MKQVLIYTIDLTKIGGKGDFACPRCENKISPEDESETVYSILGSKVKGNGLEEVLIRCNRCSSHIHLTGFSLLQQMEMAKGELGKEKREQICFISHV
jgi:DNA-directed RNA polymerase subunit RPC12/RpoP